MKEEEEEEEQTEEEEGKGGVTVAAIARHLSGFLCITRTGFSQ